MGSPCIFFDESNQFFAESKTLKEAKILKET